jgi:hypothetical protein
LEIKPCLIPISRALVGFVGESSERTAIESTRLRLPPDVCLSFGSEPTEGGRERVTEMEGEEGEIGGIMIGSKSSDKLTCRVHKV